MLCPSCGVDVGDKVGLCPTCASRRRPRGALLSEPPPPSSVGPVAASGNRQVIEGGPPLPLEPGGFVWRLFASILDGQLVYLLIAGGAYLYVKLGGPDLFVLANSFLAREVRSLGVTLFGLTGGYLLPIALVVVVPLIVVFAASLLYSALFECSAMQATPGKRLFGLVVTTVNDTRASFLRTLGRSLLKIVSAAPLLLGYLVALVNWERLTVHDVLSGTRVREVPQMTTGQRIIAAIGTALLLIMIALTQSIAGKQTIQLPFDASSLFRGESNVTARPLLDPDEVGFILVGNTRFPIRGLIAHVDRSTSLLSLALFAEPVDPPFASTLAEARSVYAVANRQPSAVIELKFERRTQYCTLESLMMYSIVLRRGGPIPLPDGPPELRIVRAGAKLAFDAFSDLSCAFEEGSQLQVTFKDQATIDHPTTPVNLAIVFRGRSRMVVTKDQ